MGTRRNRVGRIIMINCKTCCKRHAFVIRSRLEGCILEPVKGACGFKNKGFNPKFGSNRRYDK